MRVGAVWFVAFVSVNASLAQPNDRRAGSPAAAPVPETVREQSYPPEVVEAGRTLFASQCGFCHGLDTAGGSGGPDLTRSAVVAEDFRGDRLGPAIRAGRLDAPVPMPAFPDLSATEIDSLVAYIHEQKARAASAEGGRRAVTAADVQSGDVDAGRRYFDRHCAECHSATGDLGNIASRHQGLDLLRRMLNPAIAGGPSTDAMPRVDVTTAQGERLTGRLVYRDGFTIAIDDVDGRYRSFAVRDVEFTVDDPLARHRELLEIYTDDDMHDVVTFLHTLSGTGR